MKKLKWFIVLILTFFVMTPIPLSNKHKLDIRTMLHHEIYKYPNPKLLLAIIKVESNFNHKAKSKKNAIGLGQIRHTVWGKVLKDAKIIETEDDLYDIKKNVASTHYILTHYQKKSKTLKQALSKYNGTKNDKYYKKVLKEIR